MSLAAYLEANRVTNSSGSGNVCPATRGKRRRRGTATPIVGAEAQEDGENIRLRIQPPTRTPPQRTQSTSSSKDTANSGMSLSSFLEQQREQRHHYQRKESQRPIKPPAKGKRLLTDDIVNDSEGAAQQGAKATTSAGGAAVQSKNYPDAKNEEEDDITESVSEEVEEEVQQQRQQQVEEDELEDDHQNEQQQINGTAAGDCLEEVDEQARGLLRVMVKVERDDVCRQSIIDLYEQFFGYFPAAGSLAAAAAEKGGCYRKAKTKIRIRIRCRALADDVDDANKASVGKDREVLNEVLGKLSSRPSPPYSKLTSLETDNDIGENCDESDRTNDAATRSSNTNVNPVCLADTGDEVTVDERQSNSNESDASQGKDRRDGVGRDENDSGRRKGSRRVSRSSSSSQSRRRSSGSSQDRCDGTHKSRSVEISNSARSSS